MLRWQEAAATLTWISDVGALVARISKQRYRTLKRRCLVVGVFPLVAISCWVMRRRLHLVETQRFGVSAGGRVIRLLLRNLMRYFIQSLVLVDQLLTVRMTCAMRHRSVNLMRRRFA
ncbi:proline dehydrogenase 2, mitochondrial-like [Dorcoceras hygrometricum]|uniref:Proline dehydrogenase 2, mitochondrial-like n=1 Tax=Dorcoceras hygrometricum TaxID=472368 RepID=A0A2Z7BAW4_9LAMI|nr:proline dehydrogenase 2, mitochondrial-like [Dorcoceras hygrometricum]